MDLKTYLAEAFAHGYQAYIEANRCKMCCTHAKPDNDFSRAKRHKGNAAPAPKLPPIPGNNQDPRNICTGYGKTHSGSRDNCSYKENLDFNKIFSCAVYTFSFYCNQPQDRPTAVNSQSCTKMQSATHHMMRYT